MYEGAHTGLSCVPEIMVLKVRGLRTAKFILKVRGVCTIESIDGCTQVVLGSCM